MEAWLIPGFVVVLLLITFLYGLRPDWKVMQALYRQRGPIPRFGEKISRYLLRCASFMAMISAGSMAVLAFTAYVDIPDFEVPFVLEAGTYVFAGFGLFMASLYFVGFVLKAAWVVIFRKDTKFSYGPNESIVISFDSLGVDETRFMSLKSRLARALKKNGIGVIEGHELALDRNDGWLLMRGPSADDMLAVILPFLESSPIMRGANIMLRQPSGANGAWVQYDQVDLP